MKWIIIGAIAILFLTSCETTTVDKRPNILLIVADDLGYTDIGMYGGEIETPNLDALALDGVRLTQFYVAPTCSPTRAMLMSGTDNHLAGLGNMFEELRVNQKGHPGYEGHLNTRVASLPELLKDGGYHTFMAGKWHLGLTEETSPAARGFDRSFGIVQGGGGHFNDMPLVGPNRAMYREDGKLITLPEDFYSTKNYSERILDYVENRPKDGKPFFAYLAYTAPHWPLQAPEASIKKYAGRYDKGYDALQASRFKKMQALGMTTTGMQITPRVPSEKAWDSLTVEQQQIESRKMEIFAAMVDDLDHYIGTVITALKERGEYDNTMIIFLSDNGPEGAHLEIGWDSLSKWVDECCDNSFENMGEEDSYIWYGPNWARAGAAPFRMFKGFTTEGGIRVPAIVHYPKLVPGGIIKNGMTSVMDILPTLLEVAEIDHPKQFRGQEVLPLRGATMLPMLTGNSSTVHSEDYSVGWELFGRRAIRKGDWKIVWEPAATFWEPRDPLIQNDQWRLYNIANDPSEQFDLAEQEPDCLRALVAQWESYVEETGVILPDYNMGYAP